MNKLHLFVVLLFIPIISFTQVTDWAQLERSLPNLTGIEKLTALNELYIELIYQNRNKANNYAKEAINMVESLVSDTTDLYVSLQIGIAYLNSNNCLLAERYLQNTLSQCRNLRNNPHVLSDVYFTVGRLYLWKGTRIYGDIMYYKYKLNEENYDDLIKEEVQHYNDALNYFYKSIELINTLDLSSNIKHFKEARIYYFIARCYNRKTEYENALEYYLKAYDTYIEINLSKNAGLMLFTIADFNRAQIHNYNKAIEYTLRAIEESNYSFDTDDLLSLKKSDISEIPELISYFSNLGFSYYSLQDYNNALYYYLKIYKVQKIIQDSASYDNVLNYIGRAYFELKNYKQAISYYDSALFYSQKFNNKSAVAQTYYNLGLLYSELNEYEKSLNYFEKSLLLREQIGRTQDMGYTYQRLGEVYQKSGNYSDAEKSYIESYKIADSIQDIELKNSINIKLSILYENTGNFQKSLEKYKLYKSLSDSIFEQKQNEQIIRQQVNFDLESKEAELIRQKEQGIKENRQKYILYSVSGASLISIIFLIIILYYNRNKNKLKQDYIQSAQKALRAQMNPHFIFNSLGSIQNFILSKDPDVANDYLTSFAKLIRQVLENSKHNTIPLSEEVEALKTYLILENFRFSNKFEISFNIPDELLNAEVQIPPMLIQPVIENAIKHGLGPKEESGKLIIDISKQNKQLLQVVVTDNGIGRNEAEKINRNRKSHISTGIKNMNERLELINKQYKSATRFSVKDLYDKQNKPIGTQVTMLIPYIIT